MLVLINMDKDMKCWKVRTKGVTKVSKVYTLSCRAGGS